MKLFLFTICILLMLGCSHGREKQGKAPERKIWFSYAKFQGNWLIRDYFDKIRSKTFIGSFNASGYGVTEIAIDSGHRDSLWLINEDLESGKMACRIAGNDSLLVKMSPKDSSYLVFNDTTKTLFFRIDQRYRYCQYFHANDSLLAGENPVSAFRKAFNSAFAGSYVAYDPMLDQPHGINVRFDNNGTVYGLKNYRTYRIYVNGDLANCVDMDRIDFSTGSKIQSFGLTLVNKGFFLYRLVRDTKPGEKPYYSKGEFYMEFRREK
jgi:hypothetical protein